MWQDAWTCGKVGRMTQALCIRQYQSEGGPLHITQDLHASFRLVKAVAMEAPPRMISAVGRRGLPVVIYTDASYEAHEARLGAVLIDPAQGAASGRGLGATMDIGPEVLAQFELRVNQIYCCEGLACPVVPWYWAKHLAGRDVTWYIDNQAVCSAFVRGGSNQPDMQHILSIAHLVLAKIGCRV